MCCCYRYPARESGIVRYSVHTPVLFTIHPHLLIIRLGKPTKYLPNDRLWLCSLTTLAMRKFCKVGLYNMHLNVFMSFSLTILSLSKSTLLCSLVVWLKHSLTMFCNVSTFSLDYGLWVMVWESLTPVCVKSSLASLLSSSPCHPQSYIHNHIYYLNIPREWSMSMQMLSQHANRTK